MVEKESQKCPYLLMCTLFRHFLVLRPPWILRKPGEDRGPSSSQTFRKYYTFLVPLVVQKQELWCLYPDQKCDQFCKLTIISTSSLPNLPLYYHNRTYIPSQIIRAVHGKMQKRHINIILWGIRSCPFLLIHNTARDIWVWPTLGTQGSEIF